MGEGVAVSRTKKEWRIVPRGVNTSSDTMQGAWDLLHNERHVARFNSLGAAQAGMETEKRRLAKKRAAGILIRSES
jgi:hypothetical protein